MKFRLAISSDIPQIQIVRNAVKENILSDPHLVKDQDVETFISRRGKGWVCEIDKKVVGFAIVDLKENNIWALFLLPAYEAQGIGKKLHDLMVDDYFAQKKEKLWLGTEPGTRAEHFYRKRGWVEVGMHGADELKFEMTFENWLEA